MIFAVYRGDAKNIFFKETLNRLCSVIPAKAGIQNIQDTGFRHTPE